MSVIFKNLQDVDKTSVINLMNDPLVLRYMPLSSSIFTEKDYMKFIQTKETIWEKHGYGPWAFELNDTLIGWGGLQPEGEDVEIALVLHPKYWGYGKELCIKIIEYAFEILHLDSIIILFPLSRKRIKGILRLGFVENESIEIDGLLFNRYRLNRYRLKSKN